MSQLKSIFGAYAENLQVIIDNSLSRFATPWYKQYFQFAPPQTSLTFTSVIGRSRIEAAASVVARDSLTPLRSRAALEKLSGEIPAIKEKLSMTESDYRDFLTLQAMSVDNTIKRDQILDFIFNDMRIVGESTDKRLDLFVLEGISTGKISLDIDTNPDGLVLANPVDLLMPDENKVNAAKVWTDTTADIFNDIATVVELGAAKGITFGKILIDRATLRIIAKNKSVMDSLVSLKVLQRGSAAATLGNINDYLTDNQLPNFEIVEVPIAIEKDGVSSIIKPFESTNVVFVPNGQLGVIRNAVAIEQLRPATNVNYASYGKALISKWSVNEPFGEWTKAELNAFPSIDVIDGIFLLSRTMAF